MTSYITKTGDDFETIARAVYGDKSKATTVADANPAVRLPIPAGTQINTPQVAGEPTPRPSQGDTVALTVAGKAFTYWSGLNISRSLDSVDSVNFSAPLEDVTKAALKPFSYAPVVLTIGGQTIFNGTLINVAPSVSAVERVLEVSAYAKCGALNDCTPPVSSHPLEFNEVDLRAIAEKLCAPFGVSATFLADAGPTFQQVAAPATSSVWSFLAGLAKQRGLVMTNSAGGNLVFQAAPTDESTRALLKEGAAPVTYVSASFSPQDYYSDITALETVDLWEGDVNYTVKNPHLTGVVRPHVFVAADAEAGEVATAAKAKAARMFGNMATYMVTVATWRDARGELWQPNTYVTLHAPSALVNEPYRMIIRSVDFTRTPSSQYATLTLCLPGAFSGETPKRLPWE